jgi:hypothetical protein
MIIALQDKPPMTGIGATDFGLICVDLWGTRKPYGQSVAEIVPETYIEDAQFR